MHARWSDQLIPQRMGGIDFSNPTGLSRTDLVSDYLGDLAWYAGIPNADDRAVGQLRSHTSGLPDHVHTDGLGDALPTLCNKTPFDPSELISFILDEPPLFVPGSDWAYSDTGLADAIFAEICHRSFFSPQPFQPIAPHLRTRQFQAQSHRRSRRMVAALLRISSGMLRQAETGANSSDSTI